MSFGLRDALAKYLKFKKMMKAMDEEIFLNRSVNLLLQIPNI